MKKILLGLMTLSLFSAAPVLAAEKCDCDTSCRKACAEGKADSCTCKHGDCKDCGCEKKVNDKK